jgi:hypothetical protein
MNYTREDQEQMCVAEYLRRRYPYVKFTISPVSLITNAIQGMKAKRLGYSTGTPDLLIFYPSQGYHGLLIELKAPGTWRMDREGRMVKVQPGKVRPEQTEWIRATREVGYDAACIVGSHAAMNYIDAYMKPK